MEATAKQREIDKFLVCEGDVMITKDSETPSDIAVPSYVFPDFQGTGVCKINVGFKMRIMAQPPSPHHNVESRTEMSECKVLQNKRGFVASLSVDLLCSTL